MRTRVWKKTRQNQQDFGLSLLCRGLKFSFHFKETKTKSQRGNLGVVNSRKVN